MVIIIRALSLKKRPNRKGQIKKSKKGPKKWGQCSNNDDHHTFINLQHMNYNSKLEQDMTLTSGGVTGWCNESRVTCMKNNAWWLFDKYDVNYMIMQWQYDKSKVCHDDDKRNGGSCMAIYLRMAMELP